MARSVWNIIRYGFEGVAMLGAAAMMILALVPMALYFQLVQTVKGNPFWFIPSLDKSRR